MIKNKKAQEQVMPPAESQKKSKAWLWIIIIIILIAIGIGIWLWLSGGSSLPQPPALPSG